MELKRLGDIIKITSGGTPLTSKREYYDDGNIPWAKTGDLKVRHLSKIPDSISQLGLDNSSAKIFPVNTVLIAMYGATIGNCSILKTSAATNQACAALLPNEEVNEEFLFFFLSSIKSELIKKGVGGGQPNISATILKDIKIPLPSLTDQIRIAGILTQAENLITQRKESILLLDELVKSTFLEMFGDPVRNKKGWRLLNIYKLIETTINESPVKFPEKVYDYIDIASINNKSKIIEGVNNVLGSEAPSRARQLVELNDILVSTVRPNLNAVALIRDQFNNPIASTGFCILRSNDSINHEYLFMLTKSNYFINELLKRIKGANYPAVSDKDIKNVIIPLPPIVLQNKFASIVEKAETIKKDCQSSLRELENMYGVLSQKSFKGELFESEAKEEIKKKNNDVMDEEPKEKIDFEQFINKEVKEKMSIKGLTFMEYLGIPYELIENNEKWEFDFISHDVFYQFLLLEGFGNKTFTFEDIADLYFDYFYYKGDMDFDNKKWKEIIFKFLEANPPLLKQEFDTTDNIIKLKLTDEAYKA